MNAFSESSAPSARLSFAKSESSSWTWFRYFRSVRGAFCITVRQLSRSERRVSLMASSRSSRVSIAAIGPLRAFSTTSRDRVRAIHMLFRAFQSFGTGIPCSTMFRRFVFLLLCWGARMRTSLARSLAPGFASPWLGRREYRRFSGAPSRRLRARISLRSQGMSSEARRSNSSFGIRHLTLKPRSLLSCFAMTIQLWLCSLYFARSSSSEDASTANSALMSLDQRSWMSLTPISRKTVGSKLATSTSHWKSYQSRHHNYITSTHSSCLPKSTDFGLRMLQRCSARGFDIVYH